jgi:signal transduction histidine kinase
MKSIKKDIVRTITIIPAVILFSLFLSIDVVLDDWVKDKFDETLITKSSYLKSLIEVNREGFEFDFAGEFMPEFERENGTQYFQLWVNDKPFERSESLDNFPEEQLAKDTLAINTSRLIDVMLPDGRSGRAIMNYFHPQVPSRLREQVNVEGQGVFFTLAVSNEDFSQTLAAVDIIFWLLFFTLVIGIRYLVIWQIDKGLKPLSLLNEEIACLKVDISSSSLKEYEDEHIETAPIRAELLRFIEVSQQALQEEKRLSADIAHELKTPIAEIISLSELHIEYPDDLRISKTYSQDMLSIAQRMKHIVANLMMLNQADEFLVKQQNEAVILLNAINNVLATIQSTHSDIFDRIKITGGVIKSEINLDIISFNLIISNLISNALAHSPDNSTIQINIDDTATSGPQITFQNILKSSISEEQLSEIFKPLYQIDAARTDNSHYGLGLAIVDKLCAINNYKISVNQPEENTIKFSLLLNKL